MDKQNFLSDAYNGKFPISANTFDFMQNQIAVLDRIASMLSGFTGLAIIKEPTSTEDGLCAFKGEFLPLKYSSSQGEYYVLYEEKETVEAQGQLYADARIKRYVKRAATTAGGVDNKSVSVSKDFTEPLTASVVPIGGIIMWSGTTVPYNYALCNGQTKNGVQTPDLRGRFIVSSGNNGDNNYSIGDTGGEDAHTLTVEEMPSHRHSITGEKMQKDGTSTKDVVALDTGSDTSSGNMTYSDKIGNTGGGSPHENRPAYYALAFIMRVK